jgi:inorganic pyrophosphatase
MALDPHPQAEYPQEEGFWEYLERLLASTQLVIDRPKGSRHPRYPDLVYPLDYGYLDGTRASDGSGIDVWLGSLVPPLVSGILCSVDLFKHDAELKVLLGCTDAEIALILDLSNQSSMRAVFLPRPQVAGSF